MCNPKVAKELTETIKVIITSFMSKFVVTTKVKTPWYALPFILKAGFRKSIPEYRQVKGLECKYYASYRDGNFGGIYLFQDKDSAEKWFLPSWFERIEKKYKSQGIVSYYELLEENDFDSSFDYTDTSYNSSVSIFCKVPTNFTIHSEKGILRSYLTKKDGDTYICILFENEETANAYIKQVGLTDFEIIDHPVLLKN
jgi:hypothetical protein